MLYNHMCRTTALGFQCWILRYIGASLHKPQEEAQKSGQEESKATLLKCLELGRAVTDCLRSDSDSSSSSESSSIPFVSASIGHVRIIHSLKTTSGHGHGFLPIWEGANLGQVEGR